MKKEMIICIFVVIIIVLGNIITQRYTKISVETLSNDLEELKIDLDNKLNNIGKKTKEEISEEVNIITEEWELRHDKLAYYIEHNELEKVEDNLTGLNSLTETEEYADAIKERASAIVIAHNHPSGNLDPSDDDKDVTKRIQRAGEILGIRILDHLIISTDTYYSFLEHGLM